MSVTPTPLRLDTAVCDRCGRCVPPCEAGALRIGPGYIYVDWDKCTACGRCADACETGAICLRRGTAPVPASPVPATPEREGRAGARGGATPKRPVRVAAAVPPSGVIEWALSEGALVLIVAFALLVGAQALLAAIAGSTAWAGAGTFAYDAVLAGLLWYLARRRATPLPAAFRLDVPPEWTSVLLSVGVAAACWLFSVTYRASVLALGLRPPAEGADLTGLFGAGLLGMVLTVGLVTVIGPVLEEALLRGVVLGSLRARLGVWPAIVASSLAFALLHASLWSLLPLTVLGIGLGWLAVRSRSLWPAILAHVLYNGVLVAAALYMAAQAATPS